MLFHVLGPFEVRAEDRVLQLGGAQIRTLLALLTANAGRVVGVGALVEALWGMDAPPDAHRTVRTYVSRLRRSLAPADLIGTHPAGYLLRLAPDRLDAATFERLVATGREALARSRPADAAERLSAALSLWRGDAYGEFAGNPMLRPEAARLNTLRLGATEDRIAAELATGANGPLTDELVALTERHPGHSRLWELLMTALYRAGRQADALEAFGRARSVLAERFGLDPSPRLVETHRQVLDNDVRLLGPEPSVRTRPAPREAGRNDLPGDIADFAGRRDEVDQLLAARTSVLATAPTAVVIEAIDGMAGVGKTALAVHAAHRLAEHYPDGCLFIDLHGHTSKKRAVTPISALDTLLRALGVPPRDIPDEPEATAALWRAELATRSVLVVLDNAADAAQVRPLLPGTARSLVLITARRRLLDLEGAQLLSLDVLPEADAIALFTGIVGASRSAAEAETIRDVVGHCGRLPLAIRIAAARLRARPAWTVHHLADRLGKARAPLTELAAGDRSVAAAFAVSYDHLAAASSRMFRLLGLHRGPDLDAATAAAIAGVDRPEAERLLEGLVDEHLLEQPVAGRYRFHDLIRQHAHAVALTEESDAARQAALHRVVGFFLHTAYRATRLLDQQHPSIDVGMAPPECLPLVLTGEAETMAWFDANHQNVLTARAIAEEQGWHTAVWQLAWTLDNYHYRRGHLHDNITSWRAGLAAAERLGDTAVQARAHRRLGLVYAPLGQATEALYHLRRSLALSMRVGDVLGEAGAHFVLALAWTQQHDDRRALHHAINAKDLYRRLESPKWEVRSLSMIGACHTRLGHYEDARCHCEAALDLSRRQKDVFGEADSLESLGAIAHATGQHAEALDHYGQALAYWHDLDNTYRQAGVLAAVGDTHNALGGNAEARSAWKEAIELYRAQDLHTAADRIERRTCGS